MAVQAAAVTVASSTATKLTADGKAPESITVHVPSGGATVYLGPADVTTSNGFPVAATESFSIDLGIGEELYGRVASSTQAVRVLRRVGTSGD